MSDDKQTDKLASFVGGEYVDGLRAQIKKLQNEVKKARSKTALVRSQLNGKIGGMVTKTRNLEIENIKLKEEIEQLHEENAGASL